MNRKSIRLAACVSLLLGLSISTADARSFSPKLQAATVHYFLQTAGVASEILPGESESEYASSLYIPDIKGSAVLIGFPAAGIGIGNHFALEIDGMFATVCLKKGGLAFISGDDRIVAQGIFGTLECIFNELLNMLATIFDSILSLDILGLLEAVVSGILGVLICIIY